MTASLHARQRAAERYGIRLDAETTRHILREIKRSLRRPRKEGRTKPPPGAAWGRVAAPRLKAWPAGSRMPQGTQPWKVELPTGQIVRVILDMHEMHIITCLPWEIGFKRAMA